MSFDVAAEAYARFMGPYAERLADLFVEVAGVTAGQRALDVGCGPGALTARLVDRLSGDAVAAVDPSAPFLAAAQARCPGVRARAGVAEQLPFDDGEFDVALAQLVVHFMRDPVVGLREMARVVRPGGVVAACVWDHGSGTGPLSTFWRAARALDPDVSDERDLPGAREGSLIELFQDADLEDLTSDRLTVRVRHETFDEWWEPYTLGVGPAGDHVAGLDQRSRRELRDECRRRLPDAPFEIDASAWTVVARVPDGDS